MTVSHILRAKGREVTTAKSSDSLHVIAQTLAAKRIGAIVILDSKGNIEGIVSERDVVRCVAQDGANGLATKASQVMTKKVKTCSESGSETELMALMMENRIRHLPVLSDGKLSGMISIGHVVKYRIEAIEREASEMKAYIASAG